MPQNPFLVIAFATPFFLAGCQTTDQQRAAIAAIAASPINQTASALAAALAGVSPSLAEKIDAAGAKAGALVTVACGIEPAAASLAAIAAAFYGASGVVETPAAIAAAFCRAYQVPASTPIVVNARRVVRAPVRAAVGAEVSRPVDIGGITVYATGTVVDPSLVK